MTAEELDAFVNAVRAECDERLAILRAVDPDTLPLELRESYESALRDWSALREFTDDDVHALHLAACEHAGRELTPDELRALLLKQ